jgi:hypothetical protein
MTEIATRLVELDATPAQVADLLLAGGEPASSGYHDHRRDIGAATLGVSLERSWRKHG